MRKFATKFESAKQDWETPWDFFSPINTEFNFTLDAAASSTNTKVPSNFLTEEQDGLSTSWGSNTVWLNPPYGSGRSPLKSRLKKAYEESLTGATSVLLIPARTNTNWFHEICLKYGEVRFVRGRPKFGDATHGLPQPLCLVIFRPSINGESNASS
jgi:phage N-6-adenine-methyltransferase